MDHSAREYMERQSTERLSALVITELDRWMNKKDSLDGSLILMALEILKERSKDLYNQELSDIEEKALRILQQDEEPSWKQL